MDIDKKEIKKRGRKPKGGKIIDNKNIIENVQLISQNIILHLKCSLHDINSLETNVDIEPYMNIKCNEELIQEDNNLTISQKIKNLAIKLHTNDLNITKTDCFWCTYSYDNPPIHIPKCKINDTYHVYGSFCCPECAAAYLFKEKIDDSTLFERYHLLNYIYGSIFNYTKHFIPAPAPHYLITKFGGTLSIQEYRDSLRSEKILLIVNKPLCSIYPELIQSNNEFAMSTIKSTKNDAYKLCRKKNKY
jgi:hypothetical protein